MATHPVPLRMHPFLTEPEGRPMVKQPRFSLRAPLTSWPLLIELKRDSGDPLYLQIVRAVGEGIRKGRMRPGEALPGTRALAESLGVNRTTTIAAYRELEAEGWIVSRPDRGTFVADSPPLPATEEASIAVVDSGSWTSGAPSTEPFFQPQSVGYEGFRLIPDLPDVRLAPTTAIHRAHGRVLNRQRQRFLQPGWDPRGLLDLRASLCQMLRDLRGLAVDPGNMVLTRGLMSTLNLVSRALFAPGDAVVVEDPGHFRVVEAFRGAGARLFPIAIDEQGMRADALEALLAREPIKLIHLTTCPQYPTHRIMGMERRQRLLALAEAAGARILEGDFAFGFHRENDPLLPLASQDTKGTVVYFSALDQVLAPGLQVGFMVGEASIVKALAKQRQLIDWPGNPVGEATIEELFRDDEIRRHLGRLRRVTEERRESMVDRLQLHLGDLLEVENPHQGLAIWAKIQQADFPVEEWVQRCAAKGVVFFPGRLYDFHRRPLQAICLGPAAHGVADQNEACERMAQALQEMRKRA